MRAALTHHWPEYLMEAAGLGIFMLAACTFATLLVTTQVGERPKTIDGLTERLRKG